jgi:hypothetical protein
LSVVGRYGKVWGVGERADFQGASAGRTGPPVRSLSPDQEPASKADLYAAVDALRADMRQLIDEVRTLIANADRRVPETAALPRIDDDEW